MSRVPEIIFVMHIFGVAALPPVRGLRPLVATRAGVFVVPVGFAFLLSADICFFLFCTPCMFSLSLVPFPAVPCFVCVLR